MLMVILPHCTHCCGRCGVPSKLAAAPAGTHAQVRRSRPTSFFLSLAASHPARAPAIPDERNCTSSLVIRQQMGGKPRCLSRPLSPRGTVCAASCWWSSTGRLTLTPLPATCWAYSATASKQSRQWYKTQLCGVLPYLSDEDP